MRRCSWLLMCILLAACQLGAGANPPAGSPPSPILGTDITTASLDAPEPKPDAAAEKSADPAPVNADPVPESIDNAPVETPDDLAADGEAEPETTAPAPPEPPKSDIQLRCERRGGSYAAVGGDSDLRACVNRTRDGGKSCTRESDCSGQCLARSRTCSPIDPLLGCNEVLQDNGARVNLCLN